MNFTGVTLFFFASAISSADISREALAIWTVPLMREAMPVPEPPPVTEIRTWGFSDMYRSAHASARLRSVSEPVSWIEVAASAAVGTAGGVPRERPEQFAARTTAQHTAHRITVLGITAGSVLDKTRHCQGMPFPAVTFGSRCGKMRGKEGAMMRMRFFVAAALLLSAGAAFAADQMSVTVQQTSVRDKPSFLGKILGTLKYADRVTVLDQPAGAPKSFLLILGPDGQLRGWVGATALQGKKIVLAAGSENVNQSASSGEVALAGKGFNEAVEQEYKTDGSLDYTWVDRMKGTDPTHREFIVNDQQVAAFITRGGLSDPSGGAQ